ncbi:MAG: hypothetical protein ACRDAI_05600 [Candidatus Rhabdochlamydia sp.]
MMRKSIWFLLAAVVSLHGAAFADDDNNNEPGSTESVSQERDQERQGPEGNTASADQPECR